MLNDFVDFQEGWCDSQGTIDQIRAKLQMRQEGALKRERAIAYSLAQKVIITMECLNNCELVLVVLLSFES